jgi:FdhD protein
LFKSSKALSASEAFHTSRWAQGETRASRDIVASEVALALHYNRAPYAVIMATPSDIGELVLGFSLSEAIIARPQELSSVHTRILQGGIVVNADIPANRFREIDRKRRNLAGRTGCGLCGVETLSQAIRPPRAVRNSFRIAPEALQRATVSLTGKQPLNAATGSMHAAAWMVSDGTISHVREDIGRHNALDKLIGALVAEGIALDKGAALITSRASFEMIQKGAAVGIEMVCAISAPTTLAVRVAQAAGITLVAFARNGRHTVYTHGERMAVAEPHRASDARVPCRF